MSNLHETARRVVEHPRWPSTWEPGAVAADGVDRTRIREMERHGFARATCPGYANVFLVRATEVSE